MVLNYYDITDEPIVPQKDLVKKYSTGPSGPNNDWDLILFIAIVVTIGFIIISLAF